ncbi:hypothetical protein [Archangium minus]|uniref:hypothetical protein n=1 Tax=Archangium minus TaxID=83450 RepID=UPI0037C01C58
MSGKPGEVGGGTPREGPPRVNRTWRPEGTRVRVGRVVFKARTSPYAFQEKGELGLRVLAEAARKVGLPIVRLMIEVQPRPEQALCDGQQALTPERFQQLMRRLPGVLDAVDRHLWRPEVPAHVAEAR